ncbi:hypothetical protein EXS72_02090 [Candidatus Pacearchaeota archaeon]|nr:hypothetical protein [Candidatus Pacearchaeota archaeon]
MVLDDEDFEFMPDLSENNDTNSENILYNKLTSDKKFLAERLKSDIEQIIRFHIIFETENGEGSNAKKNPVLGKAFLEAHSENPLYRKTSAYILATVQSYKSIW